MSAAAEGAAVHSRQPINDDRPPAAGGGLVVAVETRAPSINRHHVRKGGVGPRNELFSFGTAKRRYDVRPPRSPFSSRSSPDASPAMRDLNFN
ncbi:hypothetical protein GWI33_013178 [Rhynchophorus ferrugineus]|uniref:Uncharacterized protein n=1 Tax=Rhynchophorus ferrugineus TaxID=354439 RepID=A0A834I702_RHYFE|nr:hypothetical protein GWI33_013178 [Rhynchophorus ferrugineus]